MVFRAIRFGGRRVKKLIAALLLAVDRDFALIYNCRSCGAERESRGCAGPLTDGSRVWEIGFCLRCDGDDNTCTICGGANKTPVPRCPRAAQDRDALLLPYFFDYYGAIVRGGAGTWPDGRGRLYQPLKLVRAFEILVKVMLQRDTAAADARGG